MVIGINGLDCAGKTSFAKRLYEDLTRKGINCALLHIDDYNNLDVQKRVYTAHQQQAFTARLLNLYYENSIHYDDALNAIASARKSHDITIIEGVFLFKECLMASLDVKIFLPINPDTARKRYLSRKIQVNDHRPASVFDDIWLPSFTRYCAETQPEAKCDLSYPAS
ncbi:hypothetical protein MNBD_ALPHA03-194 [hydrothermal vent metagenome]|uniref:Phosphoribulokinase/uridine kinase domain-containing protein n=1 Tax=hydrothermal vent metagenome TaxID=652676 RepID=A0A3B1AUC5_9ZZZZ